MLVTKAKGKMEIPMLEEKQVNEVRDVILFLRSLIT